MKIKTILGTLTVCGLLFSFASCASTESESGHVHTYATTWSQDETNHWHAATCEHTTEKKDEAAHTFEGDTCIVCNYEKEKPAAPELEYTLSADGKSYSVTGIGTITEAEVTVLAEYNKLPVTAIGNQAFEGCSSLTSIVIPDGVKAIGDRAFSSCSSLEHITIPQSVTSFGEYAFDSCSLLASIEIPAGVTAIGQYCFNKCAALTSVTIPKDITSIETYTFADCSGLTEVVLPEGITQLKPHSFFNCTSLVSIELPDSLASIDQSFIGCSKLETIKIGSGITTIGKNAFRRCSAINKVYYNGTADDWAKIEIDASNSTLTATTVTRYYYSETEPQIGEDGAYNGNYWHYVDKVITVWEKKGA